MTLRGLILIAVWVLGLMLLLPQAMAGNDPGFYNVCHQYLPMADNFEVQCLNHARQQTRYFNGEPEKHSVYFVEDPIDSHFGLGCSLGPTGQIVFLGIYYSTHPENFKVANTAKLRFADFFGNVGLVVNNEPVTLLAIRRFVTEKLRAPFPTDTTKNCEDDAHGGLVKQFSGIFSFQEMDDDNATSVRSCRIGNGVPPLCQTGNYLRFFNPAATQIIFNVGAYFDLITANGGLLVEKGFYQDSCHKYYDKRMGTPNIAQEICE